MDPSSPAARWPSPWKLAPFLVAVAAVAVFGSQFTPGPWYASLDKPTWTPPNWLFGPVWTILYVAIAVTGWLTWSAAERRAPLRALWLGQLALNAAWSWLFFGLHRPAAAFLDITLLWLLIAAFVVVAWPVRRLAAWLFVPYAAWVGFAAALNLALWLGNRAAA